MIDEIKTFEKFGYYSSDFKPKSRKKIVAICNNCGKERIIIKNQYRDLCKSCAHLGQIVTLETRVKQSKSHLNPSQDIRDKLSKANSGKNNGMYGKYHSDAVKQKISKANLNPSQETRNKFSKANSGENNPNYGIRGDKSPNWKGGKQAAQIRRDEKRKQYLDPNPIELNKCFKGSNAHHVNAKYIIYIPGKIHTSIFHRQTDGLGMHKINKIAFKYLLNNKEDMIVSEEVAFYINLMSL